jgi:uncharacterized protein (TIGR02145 family)
VFITFMIICMKTNSKIWNYKIAMLMVLLTIITVCKREETEPEPVHLSVTTEVTEISPTSATCIGKISSSTGDNYCHYHGVCWSNLNPQPTLSGNNIMVGSDFDSCCFSILLDHLTPGTTYNVSAFAENNVGTSYGNVITFSTTGNVVGDIVFNQDLTYDSITDIVGNTYKTIKIGSQVWMAENLKTSKFNDGTDITYIGEMRYWRGCSTPAYCWYLNDESRYINPYGALYNWHTVNTGKLCPTGWHVPSLEEWQTLFEYSGSDSLAGRQLRESGTAHWVMTDTGVTNGSGFTALPGGIRESLIDPSGYPESDDFRNLGYTGAFWSATELLDLIIPYEGASWDFYYDDYNSYCGSWGYFESYGLSVRCIKD